MIMKMVLSCYAYVKGWRDVWHDTEEYNTDHWLGDTANSNGLPWRGWHQHQQVNWTSLWDEVMSAVDYKDLKHFNLF